MAPDADYVAPPDECEACMELVHEPCPDHQINGYVAVEVLSARLHDVYQAEAHRRGDVRHADAYDDLPDDTKEWDRVLARWILVHWDPKFDPAEGFPPAVGGEL